MTKLAILSSATLLLAACASSPKLPDPRIEFPTPPPVLMNPPRELQTIDGE